MSVSVTTWLINVFLIIFWKTAELHWPDTLDCETHTILVSRISSLLCFMDSFWKGNWNLIRFENMLRGSAERSHERRSWRLTRVIKRNRGRWTEEQPTEGDKRKISNRKASGWWKSGVSLVAPGLPVSPLHTIIPLKAPSITDNLEGFTKKHLSPKHSRKISFSTPHSNALIPGNLCWK